MFSVICEEFKSRYRILETTKGLTQRVLRTATENTEETGDFGEMALSPGLKVQFVFRLSQRTVARVKGKIRLANGIAREQSVPVLYFPWRVEERSEELANDPGI